ncbi:MAG TPA: phage minor head protein, partial [bacterium]|nr:phage minor head protein [bacterium]
GQFLREYPESKIIGLALRVAESVETFNAQQVDKAFRKVFGADYSRFEPWMTQELKAFTKGNVALIKSIPEQYFEKVEGVVLRGAQTGRLSRDIAEDIAGQFGVSERRAALIARDQVGSFNGNLTKLRQTSVGVTKYIWSTSGDERVRPEHEAREGKEFKWSNPPPDGHPGEAINCRCVALPVFDEE